MGKLLLTTILLIFLSVVSLCHAQQTDLVIDEKPAPKLINPIQTHLRVYWHENFTGPNPTSVVIAEAPSTNSSATQFGRTYTFDNPLTLDPVSTVDVVGRAQGLYAFTSKEEMAFTLTLNVLFTEEKYNGSTILVYGRVNVDNTVKEIPIVGGSGVFKYATGYSSVQRTSFDPATFNNVIKYDLFVNHY
ncbi:Disease resistance-responsive (dirigent-like protein) familyprotein [Zostera marina]|uniref:Dirigent protein n=1 Tax=Zostera marina TaxID=29655 RepID=A0A0K9NQQ1_ZOSMR|nr:Disease resistance-responsive (dirigent-like protein) familyprotein [Zostera marina]